MQVGQRCSLTFIQDKQAQAPSSPLRGLLAEGQPCPTADHQDPAGQENWLTSTSFSPAFLSFLNVKIIITDYNSVYFILYSYNCNYNFKINYNNLFTFKPPLLRSCLPPQDEVNPIRCYLGFRQARRQSHFGTHCTTRAEPSCSPTGSGPPPPPKTPVGLLPAGLGLSQPAQQDCTRSPLPGEQPEIRGRVLAPRGSVAIPVSRIWASIRLPNTTGTNPCYSPIIALLFPTLPVPYGVHSAVQADFL